MSAVGRWQLGQFPWLADDETRAAWPRCRVIVDNDFAGDPDDLFQIAHLVMCPSVDVRAIIASHLPAGQGGWAEPGSSPSLDAGSNTAADGRARLTQLFDLMGLDASDRLYTGSPVPLADTHTPRDTPAARAIIAEALREDVDTPLYVLCGGGLTEIASAYLFNPSIAERLTVIWIGGPEYPQLTQLPEVEGAEYNLGIDIAAGQVVFNRSELGLWQVPRNAYRQCLISNAELRARVRPAGPLGAYLFEALGQVGEIVQHLTGDGRAETYVLGDQPLVLLTALQSMFESDTSSSEHVRVPAPLIVGDGSLVAEPEGRMIRVYTRIDTRLMFEDMFAKFERFGRWQVDGGSVG